MTELQVCDENCPFSTFPRIVKKENFRHTPITLSFDDQFEWYFRLMKANFKQLLYVYKYFDIICIKFIKKEEDVTTMVRSFWDTLQKYLRLFENHRSNSCTPEYYETATNSDSGDSSCRWKIERKALLLVPCLSVGGCQSTYCYYVTPYLFRYLFACYTHVIGVRVDSC